LADLAEFADRDVRLLVTTDPLAVHGLAARTPDGQRLWLANLARQPRAVALPWSSADGRPLGRIRLLQAENQAAACGESDEFRSDQGQVLQEARIELPPHAVARIDYIDKESSP
jgi:hypothetical protein